MCHSGRHTLPWKWRKLAYSVEIWWVFVFYIWVVLLRPLHLGTDVWQPSQEQFMPVGVEVRTWGNDASEPPAIHLQQRKVPCQFRNFVEKQIYCRLSKSSTKPGAKKKTYLSHKRSILGRTKKLWNNLFFKDFRFENSPGATVG